MEAQAASAGAAPRSERGWQGWKFALGILLAILVGAGVSRLFESLAITELVGWFWVLAAILVVLAVPVVIVRMLFERSALGRTWATWACCALTLALLFVTRLPWTLGFDEKAALEMLIRRFEPVAVAIGRFQAANGRLPQALGELVPGFMPELPTEDLLGRPVNLVYSRGETWSLRVDVILGWGLSAPMGELDYRPEERYEDRFQPQQPPPELEDGLYLGWHWRVVHWD